MNIFVITNIVNMEVLSVKYDIPKPDEIHISDQQYKRILIYIFEDDLDFYERHLIYLSDNQQKQFFRENPEFMSEYPVSKAKMYLLRNKMFRRVLKKIKMHDTRMV